MPSIHQMGRVRFLITVLSVFSATAIRYGFADDAIKKLILPGETFLIEGRPAFIVAREKIAEFIETLGNVFAHIARSTRRI